MQWRGRLTWAPAMALVVTLAGAGPVAEAAAPPAGPGGSPGAGAADTYVRVWDDFRHGFDTQGEDARWAYVAAGPYVADDGVVRTGPRGLDVASSGTNPVTGEPAFVRTLAQEDDNPWGLPGGLDHVKWFALADHTASTGYAGFDAVPGRALSCETWLSVRTYGTAGHPFGDAVTDPGADLRLASATLTTVDPETSTVFDFFVTNERIYAFYERLPDQRAALGNYAAFSYAVPVARRTPSERNHLKVSYDRAAGVARWLVDGREVFRVDRIGEPLASRRHMVIDHGGVPQRTAPRQLRCGLGMLNLLDGGLDGAPGLVRLASSDGTYFSPAAGEPAPQAFVDDESRESSRVFGQGVRLRATRFVVSSLPAHPGGWP